MTRLILLRHADSAWNQKNIFTGWVNIGLSAKGIQDALNLKEIFAREEIDQIYVSELIRSQMTIFLALAEYKKIPMVVCNEGHSYRERYQIHHEKEKTHVLPVYVSWELNERYYGDLQGCNKDEILQQEGEKKFLAWRRGYTTPPPHGESLEMTVERTLPFFRRRIVEELKKEKNIVVCAHGNSLRAIIKHIMQISDEDIVGVEVPTAKPLFFTFKDGIWEKSDG